MSREREGLCERVNERERERERNGRSGFTTLKVVGQRNTKVLVGWKEEKRKKALNQDKGVNERNASCSNIIAGNSFFFSLDFFSLQFSPAIKCLILSRYSIDFPCVKHFYMKELRVL